MYFKPYYLGCLAHASYLIGGDNGEAAVIDPRRDVEEYIADAEAAGLRIKHVIETHLHADFVSGHVELARRTGADIHLGEKAGAKFAHRDARDGDLIEMGDVALHFLETPGHTPEGITILAESSGETKMAFTGDTLFVGDVGRPDLAGSKGITPEAMAGELYSSLRDKILPLPDSTEVWPAHGAGSACGRSLSDDRVSTIGREKAQNPAVRLVTAGDREGFIRYSTEGLSAPPIYFCHDAQKNRDGARSIEEVLAGARPMMPAEVEELAEEEAVALDVRSVEDFGAGHIPGAIHVQLDGKFAPWVGNVLSPDSLVIVIADSGREVETVTRLARIGYENLAGWLEGGMDAWCAAGGEVVTVEQVEAASLRYRLNAGEKIPVLDVRAQSEWDSGHIPGAMLIPLPQLEARMSEVPAEPFAVSCRTGYRSSIACSLLQRAGHRNVMNVAGGWERWVGSESGK